MKDKISMGSVSEKLLNYIDSAQVHDSYYEIALTMVRNYEDVKQMSIAEMADLCYVSQATVSRFCRFLGYDSFRQFHEDLNFEFRLMDDYTKQFQSILKSNDFKAADLYRETILGNLEYALNEDNIRNIRAAADMIHESGKTAFFSHHFLYDCGHYFQSKMILMDKYVETFQFYEGQLKCAASLDENSVAVICSVTGTYFSYYSNLVHAIVSSGAKLIVITQNTEANYINFADLIIDCGMTNRNDTGKYAVLAVLDMLVFIYMKRCWQRNTGDYNEQ